MSSALAMDGVSKKFRKGELHDSLRDFIPSLVRRALHRRPAGALELREFWALRDVSFDVAPGEAFGIIGSNGAGKSTILKVLAGIMRPTLGTLRVGGRLSALIEVGAGFHPDLTGRENVYLNGTILGMSRPEIRRKFDEIVDFSGLEEFIDTPVKRYSSGMFARLGFSVAAHVDPEVLIVDEVLSVGDYMFQTKCQEKMHAILGGGATVIFVSHNLRAVTELCHRVLLLEHGRVVETGPAEQVVQTYLRRALAGVRDTANKDVFISKVAVRGAGGEAVAFRSGERAWVDIELTARRECQKLSISLFLRDEGYQDAFNTSTERLGLGTFTLRTGESFRCTYQIDLHLGQGTYHLGVSVVRYDIQREFDRWMPAASLFVSADRDVRGVANCYPEVLVLGTARPPAAAVPPRP